MDMLLKKLGAFFGGLKGLSLLAAFLLSALLPLTALCRPAVAAVAAAADFAGYTAAPSPKELFDLQGPVQGQVDLAETGGMPQVGELYGSISIEGTEVACNLYYGDSAAELHTGAGTSTAGWLPGQGGAVLIGGHTSTWFRDLEKVQVGADIKILTRYGEFHYTITEAQVIEAEEFGQQQLAAQPQGTLCLYTCYPFGRPLRTPYRYMVYAQLTSGPAVVDSSAGAASPSGGQSG